MTQPSTTPPQPVWDEVSGQWYLPKEAGSSKLAPPAPVVGLAGRINAQRTSQRGGNLGPAKSTAQRPTPAQQAATYYNARGNRMRYPAERPQVVYVQSQQSEWNGAAILAFVFSLLWLGGIGSLVGLIVGLTASDDTSKNMQRGHGLATWGWVLGLLGVAFSIFWWSVIAFAPDPVSTYDTSSYYNSPGYYGSYSPDYYGSY